MSSVEFSTEFRRPNLAGTSSFAIPLHDPAEKCSSGIADPETDAYAARRALQWNVAGGVAKDVPVQK